MADKMRLIDAYALMDQVKALHKAVDTSAINTDYDTGFHSATSTVQGLIAYMPTVDAVPVVHGHWCEGNSRQPCSVCCYRGMKSWNYCPNCGGKMDTKWRREPVKEANMRRIRDFEDKQESGLLEED